MVLGQNAGINSCKLTREKLATITHRGVSVIRAKVNRTRDHPVW